MSCWTFPVPDLGEGLESAEIVEWTVAVGDVVQVDEPLVVLETVKTTIELPSPHPGVVTALHGDPGDVVPVGAALLTLRLPAGTAAPSIGWSRAGAGQDGAASVTHLVGRAETWDVNGHGDLPRLPARPHADPVLTSPAVRRLARALRVDLATVPGSGLGGAVTADDVRAAASAAAAGGEPG